MSKDKQSMDWKQESIESMTNNINKNFTELGIEGYEVKVHEDYISMGNLEFPCPDKTYRGQIIHALNVLSSQFKWASDERVKKVGISVIKGVMDSVIAN